MLFGHPGPGYTDGIARRDLASHRSQIGAQADSLSGTNDLTVAITGLPTQATTRFRADDDLNIADGN